MSEGWELFRIRGIPLRIHPTWFVILLLATLAFQDQYRSQAELNATLGEVGVWVIAFATSRILSMKALGVGLALAVILDATIVRGVLAPAAMVMLGRRNWWPSDPTKERTPPPSA